METKITILGFAFIALTFVGFYIAYLYGRKTKQFKWSEYILLVFWPILFVFAFAYFVDIKIISMFVVSSFLGFASEHVLGFAYYKTLNKKLWKYNRLSIGGYTSLLSIPFWGVAGVFFWFVSKMIGL